MICSQHSNLKSVQLFLYMYILNTVYVSHRPIINYCMQFHCNLSLPFKMFIDLKCICHKSKYLSTTDVKLLFSVGRKVYFVTTAYVLLISHPCVLPSTNANHTYVLVSEESVLCSRSCQPSLHHQRPLQQLRVSASFLEEQTTLSEGMDALRTEV